MQALINPQPRELLLHAVLRKPRPKIVETHMIQRLILIKAGEDDRFLARHGVFVHLQALRTNFLHHALHRGVDRPDGEVARLEEGFEDGVACLLDAAHEAVGADDDEAVGGIEGDEGFAEFALGVRGHGLDDVADEGFVLDAVGGKAGTFIAAPGDDVGGFFDLLDLVAVDHFFVAGEVDDAGAGGAEFLADGEEHRIAKAAADEEDGFGAGGFSGSASGAHEDDGLAGFELGAEVGGAAHFEDDGGEEAFFTIDGSAGEGEGFHAEDGAGGAAGVHFKVLETIELAGLEGTGGDRSADDDLDDVGSEADDFVEDGADFVVELIDEGLSAVDLCW